MMLLSFQYILTTVCSLKLTEFLRISLWKHCLISTQIIFAPILALKEECDNQRNQQTYIDNV